MKIPFTICLGLALMAAAGSRSFADTPKATAAKTPMVPPRSTFTQPATQREGRDPFYPESTRVMDTVVAASRTVENTTALKIGGVSVVNGRPMVIINNHTFMAGDEGDVISGSTRAHIHCLEIESSSVIVEVNGARRVLHY